MKGIDLCSDRMEISEGVMPFFIRKEPGASRKANSGVIRTTLAILARSRMKIEKQTGIVLASDVPLPSLGSKPPGFLLLPR